MPWRAFDCSIKFVNFVLRRQPKAISPMILKSFKLELRNWFDKPKDFRHFCPTIIGRASCNAASKRWKSSSVFQKKRIVWYHVVYHSTSLLLLIVYHIPGQEVVPHSLDWIISEPSVSEWSPLLFSSGQLHCRVLVWEAPPHVTWHSSQSVQGPQMPFT